MEIQAKRQIIVDDILVALGEFGRFQVLQYCLFAVMVVLTTAAYLSYIFTAGQLDYR